MTTFLDGQLATGGQVSLGFDQDPPSAILIKRSPQVKSLVYQDKRLFKCATPCCKILLFSGSCSVLMKRWRPRGAVRIVAAAGWCTVPATRASHGLSGASARGLFLALQLLLCALRPANDLGIGAVFRPPGVSGGGTGVGFIAGQCHCAAGKRGKRGRRA